MRNLIVTSLVLMLAGAACAAPVKPTKPVNSNAAYSLQFNDQSLATNKALRRYINLSCNASDKQQSTYLKALTTEIMKFEKLVKNIPDNQDDITQVKELEVYYGTLFLVKKFVEERDKGCDESMNEHPNGE